MLYLMVREQRGEMRYHVTVISPGRISDARAELFLAEALSISRAGGQLRRPFISVFFASASSVQNEGSISPPGAIARYILLAPRCANRRPMHSVSMRLLHGCGFESGEYQWELGRVEAGI
jgi:hypothetical protein